MTPQPDGPRIHFFDLPPEERGAAYDRACERGDVENFFDLPAEERARVYEEAEDRYMEGER